MPSIHTDILDALTDQVCVLDLRGRIIAVNRAWREFAGAPSNLSAQTDVGADYFAVCDKAVGPDAKSARETVRGLRAVARGDLAEFTLVYPCHSPQAKRWFELRATRAGTGRGTGLVLAHRDVTRQRQAELSLRSSEEKYRAVVEDQTEVICRFLTDGTLVFVNEVYCRFFGKTSRELLGSKWQPVAVVADVPMIEARLALLTPATPVVVIENRVCSGTGEIRWMQFVNRAFYDRAGRQVETQAVGRDITERKQIEEHLRESERRFATLFHASPAAIGISRLADGQFLEVNDAFVRLYGYARAEIIGHTSEELHLWQSTNRDTVLQELREKRGCLAIEMQARRKSGEVCDLLATIALIELSGEPCIVGILVDLTTQKQAQAELTRSRTRLRALGARMDKVREEERTRIAREIHDELGHAVTDFKLDLGWLTHRLADAAITVRSPIGRRIASMNRRLQGQAETIRRIATELRPAVLDMLGLAAAVEWQARDFEQRTGIPCHVEVPKNLPAVEAPQLTALFRSLQELLSNIAKHARASGAEIRLTASAGQLALQVTDDGRGITSTEQLDPKALGLLGVRERASAVGGDVRVKGSPGRGTVVTITVPMEAA